jgi:glycosyltransferase involved in cell wall biosynthesis
MDKGIDILLEAFKLASTNGKDRWLGLIGDGPEREYCETFIKNNNLKNIEIFGSLDYRATLEQIEKADIIVLPSRLEAQGRAITEGFQFSKPAIGTTAGGIPELIENNKNGFLVPKEDPKAMAKAILKLAGDKKLQQKFGKAGFKFLKSMPSWDQLAEDIYLEYIKILKNRRR